ncbi:MAG: hypothetical protein ACHQHK_06895 [Dongiales bacterium]
MLPAACGTPHLKTAGQSASASAATGSGDSAPDAQPAGFTPTAGNLLGANPTKLEQWLGKPGVVRLDDPAQVWQYRGQGCVVDVYLYPSSDGMAVSHAEARSQKYTGDPINPCLAVLSQSRHKAIGS